MNQVKGTIRYENTHNFTDDQILNALNRYHAVDIYRLKKKLNGALVQMPLYIVTFNQPNLPEYVHIGWTRCNVHIYVPRPRRCFKCQKYRHCAKSCRAIVNVCVTCGIEVGENHTQPCTQPARCANCGGSHSASDTICDVYQQEAEILALQTKQRLRFAEAKRLVLFCRAKLSATYASVAAPPALLQGRPDLPKKVCVLADTDEVHSGGEHGNPCISFCCLIVCHCHYLITHHSHEDETSTKCCYSWT